MNLFRKKKKTKQQNHTTELLLLQWFSFIKENWAKLWVITLALLFLYFGWLFVCVHGNTCSCFILSPLFFFLVCGNCFTVAFWSPIIPMTTGHDKEKHCKDVSSYIWYFPTSDVNSQPSCTPVKLKTSSYYNKREQKTEMMEPLLDLAK